MNRNRLQWYVKMVGIIANHLLFISFCVFPLFVYAQKLGVGKGDTIQVKEVTVDTSIMKQKAIATDTTISQKSLAKKTVDVKRHSPAKAALFSAIVPGLGQAYNKKYWKIPIVYAGFAGLGYWLGTNVKNYKTYRNAYTLRLDDDTTTIDQFDGTLGTTDIKTFKDFYKRNLDLSIILNVVWYALNIVDATVDAHLFEFDVSDNLSLRIEPVLQYQSRNNQMTGIKFQLKL